MLSWLMLQWPWRPSGQSPVEHSTIALAFVGVFYRARLKEPLILIKLQSRFRNLGGLPIRYGVHVRDSHTAAIRMVCECWCTKVFGRGMAAFGAIMENARRGGHMKLSASPIVCLIFCLLGTGTAEAQQAQTDASSRVTPRQDTVERPHKAIKAAAAKKSKTPGQTNASAGPPPGHQELPCPRATWKDDPVCADAPDEHTLPTPSTHGAASSQTDGTPKVQVPGAENLAVRPDVQANNNPRLPGYDSVPMLDSVKKNIPDANVSSPGSRMGLGLDLKF